MANNGIAAKEDCYQIRLTKGKEEGQYSNVSVNTCDDTNRSLLQQHSLQQAQRTLNNLPSSRRQLGQDTGRVPLKAQGQAQGQGQTIEKSSTMPVIRQSQLPTIKRSSTMPVRRQSSNQPGGFPTKTNKRVMVGGKSRVVYQGKRGGEYIKQAGSFMSLNKLKI